MMHIMIYLHSIINEILDFMSGEVRGKKTVTLPIGHMLDLGWSKRGFDCGRSCVVKPKVVVDIVAISVHV